MDIHEGEQQSQLREAEDPFVAMRVSASDHDGNVPENVIDGSFDTRWSAKGKGQYIQFDFPFRVDVPFIRLAFYGGNIRSDFFEIHVSKDQKNYQRVYTGTSTGQTLDFETFNLGVQDVRSVRYVGMGNANNDWNSLTEVAFHSDSSMPLPEPLPDPLPEPLPEPSPQDCGLAQASIRVAASSHDGNIPENMLDGRLDTRWSASGLGENATFDLGKSVNLNGVRIAFYMGDARRFSFDILVSSDGTNFLRALQAQGSGSSLDPELFEINSPNTRYIRYVGYGNDRPSSWNSVTSFQPICGESNQPMPTPVPTPAPEPEPVPQPTPEPPPTSRSPIGPQPIPGNGLDGKWYVSDRAGNDSNPGTIDRPLKTLKRVLEMVRPGDIAYFREGVYGGALVRDVHGAPNQYIQLRAFPGERVVLDAHKGSSYDRVLMIQRSNSYVVFDGFEVTNSDPRIDEVRKLDLNKSADLKIWQEQYLPLGMTLFKQPVRINTFTGESIDNIIFRNLHVHRFLNIGFSISSGTSDITIENSHIHDLGKPRSGYAVYTHIPNLTMRNNIIHDVTKGLQFYSSAGGTAGGLLVENNLFYNIGVNPYWHMSSGNWKSGGDTIIVDKGAGGRIVNNIFRNGRTCISAKMSNLIIAHNLIYNCSSADILISVSGVHIHSNALGRSSLSGSAPSSSTGNVFGTSVRMVDPEEPSAGITNASTVRGRGVYLPEVPVDMLGRQRNPASIDAGPINTQ